MKRLHGQVVKLSPTSKNYVNPLDINLNYSEDENPLALKSDFVLSFCELVMGGKNGLEAIEKTVIDRAVQVIYRPYLADPKPENMPILADLHKALLDQHIPEADRVAQALDLYVSGSLNVFNHRTNIDIQNRIVAFDIKELGKQLKKIGMLIVQDQIWGRVTQNRSKGKATWYFCDEFHLLLREEQTAAFSCEIWKRFRKWGGIPTGATQNVKDLLSSPEIENILENSDFICLLNQASGDRKILAERLNISPQQLRYTYYICNVKLENFDLSHLPIYILTEEQMGFYAAYMQTLGNRPDLFPNGSYPHASTPKEPTYYEIPPEALKDEAFAAMIAEAEKYVGYPYVWGGSSPSTSFDCSGFISWVINHSGWNVGRQTAQGLYNICTPVSPEQAKPGDLVFFVGTYDTAGMSHVGLYVGNSVMLHCGDPISYTNLNSS